MNIILLIKVIIVLLLTIAVCFLGRKKLSKDNIILIILASVIFGFLANGLNNIIPAFKDKIEITAQKKPGVAANSSQIFISGFTIDGKEYKVEQAVKGHWLWGGINNDLLTWLPVGHPGLKENITDSITLLIPKGNTRIIHFLQANYCGFVNISINGETKSIDTSVDNKAEIVSDKFEGLLGFAIILFIFAITLFADRCIYEKKDEIYTWIERRNLNTVQNDIKQEKVNNSKLIVNDKIIIDKRIVWLDIAKAILIILVVLGHSGDINHGTRLDKYIYWFHMPAFIILSGLTFNAPTTGFNEWLKKRIKRLVIPYFFFLILLGLLKYIPLLVNGQPLSTVTNDFSRALIGGCYAPIYFWTLWFVSALFFTQILFSVLNVIFKSRTIKLIVIAGMYGFAHIQVYHMNTPLSIDATLIFIMYFAIGYYGKEILMNLKPSAIGIGIFLFLCFALDNHFNVISYRFDIKGHVYYNLFLDLLIPITMTITLFAFSKWISRISKTHLLQYIGMESMIILYLHEPVNIILHQFYDYGAITFTILGTCIPTIISLVVFKRFRITRFLSTGYTDK